MSDTNVLVTGIGLLSSLGEGNDAHWRAFSTAGAAPVTDAERFAPYTIHPLPQIDWSGQIPRRGDQRQMEAWQRIGTYAAGLALDDAGIKGDEQLCSTMDMVVAAGGGERDEAVDSAILSASAARPDREVLINEVLTTELRPTLFLAQLSNLMAGNISIVHKVTGSSRTLMGEEGAGVAAIESAAARIRSGRSTHMLVGGALNAAHPETLLTYELGGYLHRGGWGPVWQRGGSAGGGVIAGSGAAFLVLESRTHAESRGCKAYAMISDVRSGRARRGGGALGDAMKAMLAELPLAADRAHLAVSGASGAHAATAAELMALREAGNLVPRGFTGLTGHLKEAQFPMAVALAALAVDRQAPLAPLDSENEAPFTGAPKTVLATAIGYHRFEGMALVLPAQETSP